jgi:hypothetical protein
VRWAALALAALALTGCESSAEKSAKLEKAALAALRAGPAAKGGLKITRASTAVRVISSTLVHDTEGTAAIVTLRNDGAAAEQAIPLEITVTGSGGSTLYTNTSAGIAASLTSVSYIAAHATSTWVDDQVQTSGTATGVSAEVGEGRRAAGPPPRIELHRGEVTHEASGTEVKGTAVNRSSVTQKELVIYAFARSGADTVAAGRAVLPELASGASATFSILLIGQAPPGAAITLTAPPTTLR